MPLATRVFSPAPKIRRWDCRPDERPWFDRPDAVQTLDRWLAKGRIDEDERALLDRWLVHGCVTAGDFFSDSEIDAMAAELDARATPGAQLGAIAAESPAVRRVHGNAPLARLCSLLLGEPAVPQYSVYFKRGSEKGLHQDTAAFAVFPMNFIVGVWLACEDVSPDAGPLVYYPGSHREPLPSEFDGYPQASLKTCDANAAAAYQERLIRLAESYPKRTFLANKGDLLLWHGLLIHGGEEIRDPSLTRRSCVWHFIPNGRNVEREIVGPFNW